ncbi:MAG: DUF362 domain-containing protein [Deltaproteobacteria bacterium]|nr:DUF362 domain-containing protein [Deltaproteobacteria bacterium]
MPEPTKSKVIIRFCDAYDPERIRHIVREGLEELDLRPFGRTLVKPNLVLSGPMFPHAFTRPEFMEGVLRALKDRADDRVTELAVGERCGITMPTRAAYDGAGYDDVLDRLDVKRYCFEEVPQVEVPYTHPGRLRDYVYTPEPVALADFFVNCPKFKGHPWTTVTFSMKNYIGIQDDRHRLIDHDHKLNEKIADLQYIVQPQFIAIDAIIAGEGRMLTPIPYPMNLVVMGNNQVAFDSVCCAIIGLDARTVDHIRLAHERGFGPIDLDQIQVTGDVPFEEARARHKGFRKGLVRVEKYFEGSKITAYAGPPPREHGSGDYCWGGCPGAIEEAIEILRLFDKECDEKMARLHVVFGAYDGPIDAGPGEKVIFIGDCATWKGEIGGQPVAVESLYRERSTKDPHHAKHDDIYAKMAKVTLELTKRRKDRHIRLGGCPVSVAEHVLALASLGGVKNPYFDQSEIVRFNRSYLAWRGATALKRLMGQPYQKPGPAPRGAAQPKVG